ncbi:MULTISPECIES: NAD(P)-dependent oxidoreductase [unclassified Paenibacillus]|uniref:NAD(P)-dependent oxidoreductase n=1 Tax=unclassified Paenibacillus TaxID=185978 RepID=UPI001575D324|nr:MULTISPECIES: NAD(P)-dependent oxidoreductase [unclassified Paenibacillus]NTZ18665.1 NAD(P)-dependent oxidoreductase [Paenibacillus sp. JMULE4]
MKVGFIGLGTMGLRMTTNLLKRGFEVYVYSRSRGPIETAVSRGAMEALNPADLAAKTDIVLTCLPMPDTVEQVYFGENGIMAGIRPGMILADHSTVGPDLSRKIDAEARKKAVSFIDAPVSGGPSGAEAGTLTIMCGGDQEALNRALPVFQAMGQKIMHMGDSGSGSITKLINNMLFGAHTSVLAEALVLAEKTGIHKEKMFSVLQSSTGNSAALNWVFPLIVNREFAPRFSIDLLLKDMRIACEVARNEGMVLRVAETAREAIAAAQQSGYGASDVSAVIRPMEDKYRLIVKGESV